MAPGIQNFYIPIDSDFLSGLQLPVSEGIKQFIKRAGNDAKYLHYLRLCPYCNNFGLFSIPEARVIERGHPSHCVYCGETNPYDKIQYCFDKALALSGLAVFCASGDCDDEDTQNERTLLEQTVIILATGFEIFLRDLYAGGMNIQYIKNYTSLFSRFALESKNDFINIGKATQRFKKDLNIDFKKVFSDYDLDRINSLLLKRNLFAHNNGYVDIRFQSQSGIDCTIGERIQIGEAEVNEYISILRSVVEKLEFEYEAILGPAINSRLSEFNF